ncbi:response regulator [Schlegelella sp. S2-27]|uniref:histidine kinase n=1 Tax=Caldimonas mangrovi TaxID=2944811 RepID=A0ABT0YVR4_9BURK|nr:ATP-binding protein [Caldimonas mangrovi]MCM5682830.1 response regulator [Caldimonas mangrovi]
MPSIRTGPAADPSPEQSQALLEQRVEEAQSALMFEQARLSNLAGIPYAALLCWLLWGTADDVQLIVWLLLRVGVSTARAVVDLLWQRSTGERAQRWAHAYTALLVVDGTVYGLIGTWLLPADPAMAAMLLASVVGVASVGFVVLSANLRASVALLVPLLVPSILWQFTLGTRLGTYTALAFLLYVALIVQEGRRASMYSRAMHKLRFQMDDLAAQREQALRLAEQHSSVKSRFLATMSHEMRTPLNGLLGMLQVVRNEARDEQAREAYELMERSGMHLLRIINDVLDLSKIEAGRVELQLQPFDLAAVIGDVGRIFGAVARHKGIALEIDSGPGRPHWVVGDAVRVRQVLDNLLGNACKFTSAGTVRLDVTRDGERVFFRVEDSGTGIAPSELPRLFSPFHQADSSYARRHGGTGLGLAISRSLAQAMHGDVRCEHSDTQGSVFVFEAALPQCDEPVAAPASPGTTAPLQGRVLLVEDNPVNVIVATALLEQLGVEVESVGDGEAAIARCRDRTPDLVLMDCQMPSIDGFEATRRIRNAEGRSGRARLPIVALTANALPSDRARCLAAGMDDHLAKPVQLEELRRVLQRWLGPR